MKIISSIMTGLIALNATGALACEIEARDQKKWEVSIAKFVRKEFKISKRTRINFSDTEEGQKGLRDERSATLYYFMSDDFYRPGSRDTGASCPDELFQFRRLSSVEGNRYCDGIIKSGYMGGKHAVIYKDCHRYSEDK